MKYISLLLLMLWPQAATQDPRASVELLQKKITLLGGDENRNEFDPSALAASLGGDLEKVLAFTRQLPLHPYRGVLRGATGTLLAGAGNDADRCLLMKELIERSPAKLAVRFAFGPLTDEMSTTLARRSLQSMPGLPGTQVVDLGAVLARAGETQARLATARAAAIQSSAPHIKRFSEGFGADRAAIDGAFKDAGIVPSGSGEDGIGAAGTVLGQHVWLQVEREGKWVDLDPSFPEAKVGWAPIPAVRTAEVLPEEEQHRLGLRLVVERRNGNTLETETIYAAQRKTADLAGRALTMTLLPMGFDADKSSQPLETQAGNFTKFQAVVEFGGAAEQARVFDVQGRVFQSKNGKFGGDFGDAAGGRVAGMFGKKPTVLTAVRLEVEVSVPGQAPHVESRYLLDRLKPGSREAGKPVLEPRWEDENRFRLALFQSWTIWPAIGTVNEGFLFERLARLLARDGGLPKILFDMTDTKERPKLDQVAERIDPLPLGMIEMWQSALHLAQGIFHSGEGACYPDRASILAWKEELTIGEKGEVRWRGGVDLLYAPLGCIAKDPAKAARARFLYGLLLSESESAMMDRGAAPVFSAAVVFRKAREEKIPLLLLRKTLEGATIEAGAARLIQAELQAGRVVLIPRDPVLIGGRKATAWWRVDPVTGACLGVGDTGEGQAVSEGTLVLEKISIPMVQRCMKFVVCFNVGIGAGASMQDAGRECMSEFMQDYIKETVNNAVDQFILDPLKSKAAAGVDDGVKGMVGDPELAGLYDLARKTWGETNDKISGLSGKVSILLDMGREIAEYASKKNQDFRKERK